VEVAEVGERLHILDRAPGIDDRTLFAVVTEGVDGDELQGPVVGSLERELRATEHLTPEPGRATG
jgi:hypothetical protein